MADGDVSGDSSTNPILEASDVDDSTNECLHTGGLSTISLTTPAPGTNANVSEAVTVLASPQPSSKKKRKKRKKKKKSHSGEAASQISSLSVSLSHSQILKNWFLQMSPNERRSVLAVVDKDFCDIVLAMDQRIRKSGNGLFYDVPDVNTHMQRGYSRNRSSSLNALHSRESRQLSRQINIKRSRSASQATYSSEIDTSTFTTTKKKDKNPKLRSSARKGGLDNYFDDNFASEYVRTHDRDESAENFLFRKEDHLSTLPYHPNKLPTCPDNRYEVEIYLRSYEEQERELHQAVRLCDTKEYRDTLTFTSSMLSDPAHFFAVMRIASRGGFLKHPVMLEWNTETRTWQCEVPRWFQRMGYYTLCTFMAHKVEMVLWMRYWDQFKLDPRRTASSDTILRSCIDRPWVGRYQDLISKQHLVDFLKNLNLVERNSIILNIGRIVKEFVKETSDSFSYPQLISILLQFTSPSHRTILEASDFPISTVSIPSITHASSTGGIGAQPSSPQNEMEFVEFLFFSPLRRADTEMDKVLRRMGVFLQTAYTNKLSKDLILGEEMEKAARKSHRKNRSKSARDKSAIVASQASAPPSPRSKPLEVNAQRSTTSRRLKRAATTGTSAARSCNTSAQPTIVSPRKFVRTSHEAPERHNKEPITSPKTISYEAPDSIDRWRSSNNRKFVSQSPPSPVQKQNRMTQPLPNIPPVHPVSSPQTSPRPKRAPSITTKSHSSNNSAPIANSPETSTTTPRSTERDNSILKKSNVTASTNDDLSSASVTQTKTKSRDTVDNKEQILTLPITDEQVIPIAHAPSAHTETQAPTSKPQTLMPFPMTEDNFNDETQKETDTKDKDNKRTSRNERPRQIKRNSISTPPRLHPGRSSSDSREVDAQLSATNSSAKAKHPPLRRRRSVQNFNDDQISHINHPMRYNQHDYTTHFAALPNNHLWHYHNQRFMRHPGMNYMPTPPLNIPPPPMCGYTSPPVPIRSHHSSPGSSTTASPVNSYNEPPVWSFGRGRSPSASPPSPRLGYIPAGIITPTYEVPPVPVPRYLPYQRPMYPTRPLPTQLQALYQSHSALQVRNHIYQLSDRDSTITRRVTESIEAFVTRIDGIMAPKRSSYMKVLENLNRVVKKLWPGSKVEVYGSFATNLCIPTSDVDLVIQNVQQHLVDNSHPNAMRFLQQDPFRILEHALLSERWVKPKSVQCINTATIPVIKLVAVSEDLPVDISIEDIGLFHSGLSARELVRGFVNELPPLRPLALVLKQLLAVFGLSNVYRGGLSSYCLTLIIVSFLKLYGCTSDGRPKDLGHLLLDFLELFGTKFEFERIAISVKDEGSHVLIPEPEPGYPIRPPLIVVDPLIEGHWIGQQTFAMWQVQQAFRMAYTRIMERYEATSEINLEDVLAEAKT